MTLFEKIKATKKQDYKQAYQLALQNSIASKTHNGSIVVYAVTGETITFEKSKV